MRKQLAPKSSRSGERAILLCVSNDERFGRAMRRYRKNVEDAQLKMGELTHFYIEEHGNQYGDGIYEHVADIGGISVTSARDYHRYYLLTKEHGKNSDLSNLGMQVLIQISKLLVMGDQSAAEISSMAKKANENSMTVREVEMAVSKTLNEFESINGKKRRGGRKTNDDDQQAGDNHQLSAVVTLDDLHQLEEAVQVLELAAMQDVKFGKGVDYGVIRETLTKLGDQLLRCARKLVDEEEARGLEVLFDRMINELRSMHEDIARQEKIPA